MASWRYSIYQSLPEAPISTLVSNHQVTEATKRLPLSGGGVDHILGDDKPSFHGLWKLWWLKQTRRELFPRFHHVASRGWSTHCFGHSQRSSKKGEHSSGLVVVESSFILSWFQIQNVFRRRIFGEQVVEWPIIETIEEVVWWWGGEANASSRRVMGRNRRCDCSGSRARWGPTWSYGWLLEVLLSMACWEWQVEYEETPFELKWWWQTFFFEKVSLSRRPSLRQTVLGLWRHSGSDEATTTRPHRTVKAEVWWTFLS